MTRAAALEVLRRLAAAVAERDEADPEARLLELAAVRGEEASALRDALVLEGARALLREVGR